MSKIAGHRAARRRSPSRLVPRVTRASHLSPFRGVITEIISRSSSIDDCDVDECERRRRKGAASGPGITCATCPRWFSVWSLIRDPKQLKYENCYNRDIRAATFRVFGKILVDRSFILCNTGKYNSVIEKEILFSPTTRRLILQRGVMQGRGSRVRGLS